MIFGTAPSLAVCEESVPPKVLSDATGVAGGKARGAHYVCNRRRQNGSCSNETRIPVAEMNETVLAAIEIHALTPEAVEAVIASMQRDHQQVSVRSLDAERAEVQKRIDRLVGAIEAGGEMDSLLARLRENQERKAAIDDEMASARPIPLPPRAMVEDRLAEWRRLLRQSVATGRAVLDRMLDGRIVFTPVGVGYEFTAPTRFTACSAACWCRSRCGVNHQPRGPKASAQTTCTTAARTTWTTAEFWSARSTV